MAENNFLRDSDRIMAYISRIVEKSHKTNDYKFALAKFLLDHSKKSGETEVSYADIAEHFLKTYWDQGRLRRSNNPNNEARITEIVESNRDRYYKKPISKFGDDDRKKCTDRIITECFNHVIARFQDFEDGSASTRGVIFEFEPHFGRAGNVDEELRKRLKSGARIPVKKESPVRLNQKAVDVMYENYEKLSCMLVREWTRFLEGFNMGVPKILEKIEHEEERKSLSRERKILEEKFGLECFYCGKTFDDLSEMHADHVLPRDYVRTDGIWDLVLAGRTCNEDKGIRLPRGCEIERLIERNKGWKSADLEKSLDELNADFGGHIRRIYSSALDIGYPMWKDRNTCRQSGM